MFQLIIIQRYSVRKGSAPTGIVEFRQNLRTAVAQMHRVLWAELTEIQPDVAIPDPQEDLLTRLHLAVLQVETVDPVGYGQCGH